MVDSAEASSLYSSLRERIVEHRFLGDVLRCMWRLGAYTTEVSRAESDAFGYDLAIEHGKIIRHIQLKSKLDRAPIKISLARSLADKPSGCAICIVLDDDLEPRTYYWFGSAPGEPLPDIAAFKATKRIRRDKEGKRPARPNHVDVPIGRCERVDCVPKLVAKLFGDRPGS